MSGFVPHDLASVTGRKAIRRLYRTLRSDKDSKIAASLVMTSRNRSTYLDISLAALMRQIMPKGTWEAIVIDDASKDDTDAVLDRYKTSESVRLIRQFSSEYGGYAGSLNKAMKIAQGRILVFVRDDRVMSPDFVLQHLLLQQNKSCIVIGDDHLCIHTHLFAPDEPALSGVDSNPLLAPDDLDDPQRMSSLVFPSDNNYGEIFAYFDSQRRPAPYPWACFTTANASVPREAIERIGGFDEGFSGWGLEDTDLAYRLHQAGLGFQFAPKAVTLRQVRPYNVGQKRDLNRNLSRFLCKHKELTAMERSLILRGSYTPTG